MPRLMAVRLFFIWLAFTVNDYDEPGKPRLGLTAMHALNRAGRYAAR